jgi:hypothetical protein
MSKNAERMSKDRNKALVTLNALNETLINDLVRRASTRATVDQSPDEGAKSKGGISNPTLNAVVRTMSCKRVADPIYDSVKELAVMLSNIAELAQRIDERVAYITDTKTRIKEAEIVNCQACLRECGGLKDRVKSGYCQACYMAWYRLGMPYRATFELQRREELAESLEN